MALNWALKDAWTSDRWKDDGEHFKYDYMSNYADRGVSTQWPVSTSA